MKGKRENRSFPEVGTSGRRVDTRKGGIRVNMVDVFGIHT
jgi:hypothetical protein